MKNKAAVSRNTPPAAPINALRFLNFSTTLSKHGNAPNAASRNAGSGTNREADKHARAMRFVLMRKAGFTLADQKAA